MPKIYTKQGDHGQTSLPDGEPIPKDFDVLEACGTIDELGAVLGLVRAEPLPGDLDAIVERVQHELFELNSELADPTRSERPEAIAGEHVRRMEEDIDQLEAELKPLASFILAGGTREAALLHVGRTVCRRAERRLVRLSHDRSRPLSGQILMYVNRLADLLFVLARAANARSGHGDVKWRGR